MQRLFGISLALALMLAGNGADAQQKKPNFSGDWKMNVVKSDFGAAPTPGVFTRKIVHVEPAITIDEEQETPIGMQQTTRKYTTDGTESKFNAGGADVRGSAKWEGNALIAVTNVDVIQVVYNDRMTLSDDGKVLTSAVKVSTPQGAVDVTVVFEKQ